MTEGGYLEVKNWEEFQHYKDRDPLWIKLYRRLQDNYDWLQLPDASKAHLVGLWILASKHQNRIPANPAYIAQRIGATERVNLEVLVRAGFIGHASGAIAGRQRNDCLETETETEKEKHGRGRTTWLTPFADVWATKCGTPPYGKLGKILRPLVREHGEAEVLERWRKYVDATEPRYASVHRFAETFVSWGAPTEIEMTDDVGVMRLHRLNPVSGEYEVA